MRGKVGRFSRRQPFSPLTLSGLTGWWDASDASTLFDATSGGSAVSADGGVARLEDKSQGGRHFKQSSSTFRPLRKTSVKNGLDVIRFDGSDDVLEGSDFIYSSLQSSSSSSIFIVAKATAVNTNSSVYLNDAVFSETFAGHGAFALSSANTVAAYGYDETWRTAEVAYTAGDWISFASWHDGTSIYAQKNNDAAVSASLSTRQGTSNAPRLGANYAAAYFDGDFGELLTFNVALSESDRAKVISYLTDKWGIT